MRAREIAEEYPVVDLEADALEMARLLASERLPGIVVTDSDGRPRSILPASQVLRFVVPEYIQDDPSLARVYDEAHADKIVSRLSRKTVRELVPRQSSELPVVDHNATVVEVAALMARIRCPLVAVTDGDDVLGVITATRLLGLILA